MRKSSADSTTTATMEEVQSDFVTSCSNVCLTKAFCVAVIFTKNTARCRLQKSSTAGIITMIETDSHFYEFQFESSDRKICKSLFVVHLFSLTTKMLIDIAFLFPSFCSYRNKYCMSFILFFIFFDTVILQT